MIISVRIQQAVQTLAISLEKSKAQTFASKALFTILYSQLQFPSLGL
jgi:hypothetical protein